MTFFQNAYTYFAFLLRCCLLLLERENTVRSLVRVIIEAHVIIEVLDSAIIYLSLE